MSENVEEFENDDYDDAFYEIEDEDLRSEVEELRHQVEVEAADRAQVAAINRVIEEFRFEHGLRLSAADVQSLGEMIDAGHSVEDAYRELEAGDFEDVFDQALEKVERQQGRSLLQSEVDRLWEASVRESDPEHIDQDAILNLDNDSDRAQLIDERLSPPPDPVETVAPLDVDATADERAAYAEARVAGAEVETEETE